MNIRCELIIDDFHKSNYFFKSISILKYSLKSGIVKLVQFCKKQKNE